MFFGIGSPLQAVIFGDQNAFIPIQVRTINDVKITMTNIYIQQGSFIAWSRMWDFRKGYTKNTQFEHFVTTWPDVGERVLIVLGIISDIFVDVKQLQSKYGIQVTMAPKVP